MSIGALVMAAVILAALLVVTATWAAAIERAYPASGRLVPVTGGRLHVVDLSSGENEADLPVVLLHGASGNLNDMRVAFGERLAATRRVILIDRPGHGWSDRPGGMADAAPARQAMLVREALDALGVRRAIFAGYSWSGALATAFALAYPERVAGLVLIAPVTHPWPRRTAWYHWIATTPVLGPLFARTVALPLGMSLIDASARAVFAPQEMPDGYVERIAAPLLLRPAEFLANAFDVTLLSGHLVAQSKRYGEIRAPTVIITGDRDGTVSQKIHSEAIAAMVPNAELIVVPGVGHMVHHLAPDIVIAAIERVTARADAAVGAVPATGAELRPAR
jgi:pimeloyl-ACP methyl ester carboxylesterase